tara:strand:+ start:603 stop:1742 length:1140 start_codon:yes stop_codon:yes gene_type:complete
MPYIARGQTGIRPYQPEEEETPTYVKAAKVAGTGTQVGLSSKIALDKLKESALNRSGVLSKQIADTTTNQLVNMFVRDETAIKGSDAVMPGKLGEIEQMGRDFLKGTSTPTFERVKLNPAIQDQYSYDEIYEMLEKDYSSDTVDTLLRPETTTDEFFSSYPSEKVIEYGKQGKDSRAVYQGDIFQNVKDINKYQNYKPQDANIIDYGELKPDLTPQDKYGMDLLKDTGSSTESYMSTQYSAPSLDKATKLKLDETAEMINSSNEKLTSKLEDLTAPEVPTKLWSGEAVKGTKMLDPSTWTRGGEVMGTLGKIGTGINMASGAYEIGSTLVDAFEDGELDWENGKDLIQGSVKLATPYLVAAGPAGWAVLGANQLWEMFD